MRIVLDTNILARANPRSKSVARVLLLTILESAEHVLVLSPFVARNGASVELSPLASPLAADTIRHRAIHTGDSFFSVDDLITAINEFLAAWNDNPKPFVWTATVDSIVAKPARCRQTLEQIQPGCTAPKRRKRLSS